MGRSLLVLGLCGVVVASRQAAGQSTLFEAAKRGDVETIERELAGGIPVDLRVTGSSRSSWENTTPLMWAAVRGQVAAVRALIKAGADLESASDYGTTALMAAAGAIRTIDGDPLGCVHALIDAGADIRRADHLGIRGLMYACGGASFFDLPPDELLAPEYRLPDPFEFLRPNVGGAISAPHVVPMRVVTARRGDPARVRALIEAGADVNATDDPGRSVLAVAAGSADAERVGLLLAAGADINARTIWGRNALTWAAASGDAEMFKLLLDAGGDFTVIDDGGQTVLMWAARSREGAERKVRALLDAGADLDKTDSKGNTALVASLAWRASGGAATILLERGADPRVPAPNGDSVFLLAAKNGAATTLEALLRLAFDLEEPSKDELHPTALALAASSHRDAAAKVRLLLKAGSRIDAPATDGTTALLAASRQGNMDAVEVLTEAGANVNVVDKGPIRQPDGAFHREGWAGWMPLMYVAHRGADSTFMCEATGNTAARVLIEAGADVNAKDGIGRTVLMLAAEIGHVEMIDPLIAAGADVNATAIEPIAADLPLEHTVLGVAIELGKASLVAALLAAGADVNARSNGGQTPLMYAMHRGDPGVVKVLLQHRADVNASDDTGRRPLMHAVTSRSWAYVGSEGPEALMRRLLEDGADVNAADKRGRTPLMYAAELFEQEPARILVEAGADLWDEDHDGKTALDIARESLRGGRGRYSVLDYLERVYDAASAD